jgi:hypothetical protein
MTIQTVLLLAFIQTVLSAVVASLALVKYSSRGLAVRLIGFVFLAGCLANVASWVLVRTGTFRGFTNTPAPIYLIINLCLYSRLYYVEMHRRHGRWFVIVASLFCVFALVNILFIQKTTPNSYTFLFHSGILLTYSLLYFYFLIHDLPSLHVHRLPMFWFNSALLIFHAGTFFLFSFTSYLVNVLKDNLIVYWSFHNVLSIIEHFIFLVGLYYDFQMLPSKAPKSALRR